MKRTAGAAYTISLLHKLDPFIAKEARKEHSHISEPVESGHLKRAR